MEEHLYMSIKKCNTRKPIELIDDNKIRTSISTSESIAIPNKARVYKGTLKHFTDIKEKDHPSLMDTKELYYSMEEGKEIPLDKFRQVARDNRGKQMILDGLLELFYLVSEGKLYDIEINPMNFVAEDRPELNKVFVKAFYRDSRGLREITDTWLTNVKKIIGYFLVTDTGYNEQNFNETKPAHYLNEMTEHVYDQYLKIMKSTTVDQMAKEWFSDDVYRQLKGFPPIMRDFRRPKDVTIVARNILGYEEIPEVEPVKQEIEQEKQLEPTNTPAEKSSKRREVVSAKYNTKKRTGKGKVVLLIVIGAVLGGFISNFLWGKGTDEIIVNEHYYNGILQASMHKNADAAEEFDKIPSEEISEMGEHEKVSIFFSYLLNGEYDKALKADKDGAESVINYLDRRDNLEYVKNIESELPAIAFEKAVINKEYEQVISLKEQVKDTTKRQVNVVEALIKTGDIESAVEYAKVKELDDIKKTIEIYYQEYTKDTEVSKEDKEKVKELMETL